MTPKSWAKLQFNNHIHIRGENNTDDDDSMIKAGSPPHTWRKHPAIIFEIYAIRITSTYVEKTTVQISKEINPQDHLHIRGENRQPVATYETKWGSPLHTWRKHLIEHRFGHPQRITSTYVEKTVGMAQSRCNAQDHLHIRGENLFC